MGLVLGRGRKLRS